MLLSVYLPSGIDMILLKQAERMIANNERTNNGFYISPCYNHMIAKGKRIGIYDIVSEGNGMYGLGIPEDLDFFLSNPISERVRR